MSIHSSIAQQILSRKDLDGRKSRTAIQTATQGYIPQLYAVASSTTAWAISSGAPDDSTLIVT